MALGLIEDLKDAFIVPRTLFLAFFTFQNTTTTLLLSTVPLNPAEGGPTFPGIGLFPAGNYIGRLSETNLTALQQRSQLGIDRFPSLKVQIFDADHFIWNNYCAQFGFRGASLRIGMVMWQPGTSLFSNDVYTLFLGTCDMERPAKGLSIIEVTANTSHNTATVKLPLFPIQNRCPLVFPINADMRLKSTDPGSTLCIYSPDQPGGVGNLGPANHKDPYGDPVTDGNGIYISCDYLRSNPSDPTSGCMARLGNAAGTNMAPDGDLLHDQSGRTTGGFAGVQWSPGTFYAINKNFVNSSKIPTFSTLNSAILGQYQNLLFGKQWVDCKVANVIESGNDTKCEAMVCTGDIGSEGISQVVVNGVTVNRNPSGDPNLFWGFITSGGRYGQINRDTGYSSPTFHGLGDPYGQIATFEVVVYNTIFTGFGTPSIRALSSGPGIPVYTDQTTYTINTAPDNTCPPWVLLKCLMLANWQAAEINMQTLIDAASYCNAQINYYDASGIQRTHARFKCQFALQSQQTAANVIAAILRSFNGYLSWGRDGRLELHINQTLADSQPNPINGSNFLTTPVNSIHVDNSNGIGYVACYFDESNISMVTNGDDSYLDFEFKDNATSQTPNQIFIKFQDEDNQFVEDSLGEIDADAVNRAGGALQPGGCVVPETLNVLGIAGFDYAIRCANVYLAERQRGNEFDDPRGTRVVEFGTGINCSHLRGGHIIQINLDSIGIVQQLFRVIGIAAGSDGKRWRITASWHNEVWYTDLYGQAPQALYSETNRNLPVRGPNPWQPFAEQPNSLLYSPTEYNFTLAEVDTTRKDNTTMVTLVVGGVSPVAKLSTLAKPPLSPIEATVTGGGDGTILTGYTVMIQICAVDVNGGYSAPTHIITGFVPSTAPANSALLISNLGWQSETDSWDLFAGYDSYSITHQLSGTGTPSSILLASMPNVAAYGPPDLKADSIELEARSIIHSGLYGIETSGFTSTTITLSPSINGNPFSNDLTGYPLMLIGRKDWVGNFPIIDFQILSNSSYDLTVDRDPTSLIFVDDLFTIPYQANIVSSTTIGDTNLVNPYTPSGADLEDVGRVVVIIHGTGRYQERTIVDVDASGTFYTIDQPWNVTPDSTSYFMVVESSYRYFSQTTKLTNSTNTPYVVNPSIAAIDVDNYADHVVMVRALINDAADDKYSNEFRSPWRPYYIFGVPNQNYQVCTFGIDDSTVGNNVTLHIPIKIQGTAFDTTVRITVSPSVDTNININQLSGVSGGVITSHSIYAAGFITIPAGSTGEIVYSIADFAIDPLWFYEGDAFSIDILSGAGDGEFEVVPRWVITDPPLGSINNNVPILM